MTARSWPNSQFNNKLDNQNNNTVATITATEIPIFQPTESRGCHQIMGKASGPTLPTATTMAQVRKYQGKLFAGRRGGPEPSRNSPQCLHLIASS